MNNDYPFLVPPGWERAEIIRNPGRPMYRLLFYPDGGGIRFEHRCDRGDRGVIVCAPKFDINHQVVSVPSDPGHVTVTPSILCPDCGTHGFIRDGRWLPA